MVGVKVGRRVTTRVGARVRVWVAVGLAVGGGGVHVAVGTGVSVGTNRANLVGPKDRATRVLPGVTSTASERLAGAHPIPDRIRLASASARRGKDVQRESLDLIFQPREYKVAKLDLLFQAGLIISECRFNNNSRFTRTIVYLT